MDFDLAFRRLQWASIILLIVGGIMLVFGLAFPQLLPLPIVMIAIVVLIAALLLRLVTILDHIWRRLNGRPARRPLLFSPTQYTCPNCGYMLRGVEGIHCPECGTIRPAPLDSDQSMD
jgi:hypothetical protein